MKDSVARISGVKWLRACALLFYIWVLPSMAHALGERYQKYSVIDYSTQPNYGASVKDGKSGVLTDGVEEPFPCWVKAGCVVWEGVSPLGIELRAAGSSNEYRVAPGLLRIHTSHAGYAGISPPMHVEVYSLQREGNWRSVGSVTPDARVILDRSSGWISVPLAEAGIGLFVVVHANGRYIVIDEIQFDESDIETVTHESAAIDRSELFEDSARRVSNALMRRHNLKQENMGRAGGTTADVWLADPYAARLEEKRPSKAESDALSDLSGTVDEHQAILLRVSASDQPSGVRFRVKGCDLPTAAWSLFEVGAVAAADGTVVHDALIPREHGDTIVLSRRTLSAVWISVDLGLLGEGTHTFKCTAALEDKVKEFSFYSKVVRVEAIGAAKLHAINWAYLNDSPVMKNRNAALEDLKRHGIDVFVANPPVTPGATEYERWEFAKLKDFDAIVQAVKDVDGMLLLYLGWTPERNPFLASPDRTSKESAMHFWKWLKRMTSYLESKGLTREQWALYPFDEPDGSQLKTMVLLRRQMEAHALTAQMYADPTIADGGRISLQDLHAADEAIDLWQPNLGLLSTSLSSYFRSLDRPWWLYENPRAPAKAGSPFKDYLLLSWHAWDVGASGVGFWSYSDTTNSSAWSDFDGRRADWAVVYESSNGPISSRRWEAFRKGLEDVSLVGSSSADAVRKIREYIKRHPIREWNWRDRQAVRRVALEGTW